MINLDLKKTVCWSFMDLIMVKNATTKIIIFCTAWLFFFFISTNAHICATSFLSQDYHSSSKFSIPDERISHLLPACYQDMIVRVYSKKPGLVCHYPFASLQLRFPFTFSPLFFLSWIGTWIYYLTVFLIRYMQYLRRLRTFSWRLTVLKHKYTRQWRRKGAGYEYLQPLVVCAYSAAVPAISCDHWGR